MTVAMIAPKNREELDKLLSQFKGEVKILPKVNKKVPKEISYLRK